MEKDTIHSCLKWSDAIVAKQARPSSSAQAEAFGGPSWPSTCRARPTHAGTPPGREVSAAAAGSPMAKTRRDLRGNGLGASAYVPLHMD
jgi:hypothetical protein